MAALVEVDLIALPGELVAQADQHAALEAALPAPVRFGPVLGLACAAFRHDGPPLSRRPRFFRIPMAEVADDQLAEKVREIRHAADGALGLHGPAPPDVGVCHLGGDSIRFA